MSRSHKIVILSALIVGILVFAWIMFDRKFFTKDETRLNQPTNNVASLGAVTSTSPSPTIQIQSTNVKLTEEQEARFDREKKRLSWMSDDELRTLIVQGLNVENIEGGIKRVNNDTTQLVSAIRSYKERYGMYPTGTSVQVAKSLSGENLDKIVFIDWPSKFRSSLGEFLDQWGVPYDIRIENNIVTIRSAGPDKLTETEDDTVLVK